MRPIVIAILAATCLIAGTAVAQPERTDPLPWSMADLVRTHLVQKTKTATGGGEGTMRVLVSSRDAALFLAPHGRRSLSYGGVTIVDMREADWRRSRSDAPLIVADEGFLPSESNAAGLAHASELHKGLSGGMSLTGKNVLLAIYDSGIDWRNEAFRIGSGERATSIALVWDQTESPSPALPPPAGQVRGRLYDRAALVDAMAGLRSDVSTTDRTGHGTAVATVARGVAPGAELVIIKGGDERFSQTGLVEALAFLDSLASARRMPVVLNLSFGNQRGPHDGTQLHERAIEAFVSRPGRFVVAAAGNDGGRRVHAEGATTSALDSTVVTFTIPPYVPNAGLSNDGLDIEIWFSDTTEACVILETPAGRRWDRRSPGSTFSRGEEGVILIDRPTRGRVVTVQLSDAAGTPPAAGMYRLIVHAAASFGQNAFHAWITGGTVGADVVRFDAGPSAVTERATIQSPAVSVGALSVGASDVSGDRVAAALWSSSGPSIDGREKPEIHAPGRVWLEHMDRSVSGTSFSAPLASGAAAILFQANPLASADVIRRALMEGVVTAGPGSGTPNAIRLLDAAAAVAALKGLDAFPATYVGLRFDDAPSARLSWTTSGLSGAVRFALIDRVTRSTLASWPATPGASIERVSLMAEVAGRMNGGGAMFEAIDDLGRAIRFTAPSAENAAVGADWTSLTIGTLRVEAHPNPFNAATNIDATLPADGDLSLVVYTIDGREVERLHDGPVRAGPVRIRWSSSVASGVYVLRSWYRPEGGSTSDERSHLKLVMLK